MSVSEIIEMKKIGDPNLSSLIEVLVPIYVIEPHPAAPERDLPIRKHRHKRDKIRHRTIPRKVGNDQDPEIKNRFLSQGPGRDEVQGHERQG